MCFSIDRFTCAVPSYFNFSFTNSFCIMAIVLIFFLMELEGISTKDVYTKTYFHCTCILTETIKIYQEKGVGLKKIQS
jgi:hypothetical protein